jgi:4-carboxymuconolactone decarboxylase
MTDSGQDREPSGAQRMFGDFAPALVGFTDDVLFGQVWERRELSSKERSLVTVAALTAMGNTEQLVFHLGLAKQNGNTEEELVEVITHLAFYAGWPKAMAAMAVAKQVLQGQPGERKAGLERRNPRAPRDVRVTGRDDLTIMEMTDVSDAQYSASRTDQQQEQWVALCQSSRLGGHHLGALRGG